MPSEQQQQQQHEDDGDSDFDDNDDGDAAPLGAEELEALTAELSSMDVDELQEITNITLADFSSTHSEAQQQFIADVFVDSGVIPTGETFGISEADAEWLRLDLSAHWKGTCSLSTAWITRCGSSTYRTKTYRRSVRRP